MVVIVKNFTDVLLYVLLYRVFAERVSSFGELASCSGRRSGGRLHPDCVPMGGLMRCLRHRMTGRIGLHHRGSRGIDTSHTSKSRWAARRLQSGILRLNLLSVPMAWIQSLSAYRQPSLRRRHQSVSYAPAPDVCSSIHNNHFEHYRVFR